MSQDRLNPDCEYVVSLLHGWWGRAAQGSILDELVRCATCDNLLRQLSQRGIAAVSSREHALEEFELRQDSQLARLEQLCPRTVVQYIEVQRMKLYSENVKLLLAYRYLNPERASLQEGLVNFPESSYSNEKLQSVMEAPDAESFVRLVNIGLPDDALLAIVKGMEKEQDLPAAEAAIDTLGYSLLMKAAANLPGGMRKTVKDHFTAVIDCENLMTLLRNASFYHLDGRRLESSWVGGGKLLTRSMWERFACSGARYDEIMDSLPADLASLACEESVDGRLAAVEHRIQCMLYRRIRKAFYDGCHGELTIAAYPILLGYETLNLQRIYEGIRFSLPPREITGMLIR